MARLPVSEVETEGTEGCSRVDGTMPLAGSPDPVREEGPRPASPTFGAPTAVDEESSESVAAGATERSSDCLASPFPDSAMELGWAFNMADIHSKSCGGNAAETAAATIEATASRVIGGSSETEERERFELAFESFTGLRLCGVVGVGGKGSSIITCSVAPSGMVTVAMTGALYLEPDGLTESAGFFRSAEGGTFLFESDMVSTNEDEKENSDLTSRHKGANLTAEKL